MTSYYLRKKHNNELIEYFRKDSSRFNLFISLFNKKDIQLNEVVSVSKQELIDKIAKLLKGRDNKISISFENRFVDSQCYEIKEFRGEKYKLETSGYDNLIIFALNILENIENEIIISNK